MSTATSRNCCFMPSQSWLTTSQLTMGACPPADATVKPFAARPVLLSYTNAAPTVINAPSIIPNKIRIVGVSHRSERLNSQFLIGFHHCRNTACSIRSSMQSPASDLVVALKVELVGGGE